LGGRLTEGNEFVSRLEEVLRAEELDFEPTPSFGRYRALMPPESVAHPAKFNTNLVEFLILNHTRPNEVVLDPMAGTGVLGVVASLHGRNAVQVELERKFYEWMERARENVERHPSLSPKGWIRNILGDARQLSALLGRADVAITSPPYEGSYLGGGDVERRRERLVERGYDPQNYLGGKARNMVLRHYDEVVDAVITSPPYLKCAEHGAGINRQRRGDVRIGCSTLGRTVESSEAIDNTKEYGTIDVVITSPPYSSSAIQDYGTTNKALLDFEEKVRESFKTKGYFEYNGRRYSEDEWRKINKGELKPRGFPELWAEILRNRKEEKYNDDNPSNIANLTHGSVDAVITSPPYEGSFEGGSRHTGGILEREKSDAETRLKIGLGVKYSDNEKNIGNLKSSDEEYEALVRGLMKDGRPTYLSEMLKVYSEMHKVIRPNGLCIVVVKPFIRNKRVIDLPYHTYLLMTKVGFRLRKLYKLRLRQESFWRILYRKKHPEVPRIAHEYVLVCQKGD
jgi:DNA modification methylase